MGMVYDLQTMTRDSEPKSKSSPPEVQIASKKIGFDDEICEVESIVGNKAPVEETRSYVSLGEYLLREKTLESRKNSKELKKTNEIHSEKNHSSAWQSGRDTKGLPNISPHYVIREEEDVHMDEPVREVEQPKMIVCFQKESNQIVKDICVDEGMHRQNNVLVQGGGKTGSTPLSCSSRDDTNSMADKLPTPHGSESLHVEGNSVDDMKIECITGDATHMSDRTTNGITTHTSDQTTNGNTTLEVMDNISNESIAMEPVVSQKEDVVDQHQSNMTGFDSGSVQVKSSEKGSSDVHLPPDQDPVEELNSSNSTAVSSTENLFENERSMDIPSTSKCESGSNSSEMDPILLTTGTKEDSKGTTASYQPDQTTVVSSSEKRPSDSATLLPRSSLVTYGNPGSDMHVPGSMSDRISYTGQLQYSGSISLRSDSSTTSTRSFAFPILQTEWNSSPVKMAKADRRQYRGNRCWPKKILCCKF